MVRPSSTAVPRGMLTSLFCRVDPTHGQVEFQGKEAAQAAGLAYLENGNAAVLAVDSTTWLAPGTNRKSYVPFANTGSRLRSRIFRLPELG